MKQITDKQRTIAEQSVYGDLKILQHGIIRTVRYDSSADDNIISIACCCSTSVKPILRPLSWLTREITHEGFNGGEPFVPLIELQKLNRNIRVDGIIAYYNYGLSLEESLEIIKVLNCWHFDIYYLIDKGDAVSTEEVGDVYAVKNRINNDQTTIH